MRWLDITRPPCFLHCCYCGTHGRFAHAKSYDHLDETLSLYECSTCQSLIYDLAGVDAPIVSQTDSVCPEAMRNARYVFESGSSARHVAMCALASLPDVSEADLRQHVFIDIGAGLGLASQFVKTLFGMRALTVEPSYTGKIAHDVLGLEVHRQYFEELPEELLAELKEQSCCLHLNSVVEHLVDPYRVLREMLGTVKVKVLAAVVPDGGWFDFEAPFVNALPFLAPRDHRHLPTKLGMEMLFRRLGFAHIHVHREDGLLTAVGSRLRMAFPSDREIRLASNLFLENLLRHPDAIVAGGAGSRLLPVAVFDRNALLMAALREHFPFETQTDDILKLIETRAWDDLPFHLGPSCYWLASDAMSNGRLAGALSLLKVSVAFGDAMGADFPQFAMAPLEFKWAALALTAHIHRHLGELEDAERALKTIVESKSDALFRARTVHRVAAERELEDIRAQAADVRAEARNESTSDEVRDKAA